MEFIEKSKGLFGLLVLLATCSELVLPCTISSGYANLGLNERLTLSNTVVYGKTIQHKANVRKINGKTYASIDALFEVFCVLKEGEDPVPEEILIERISPRDGCSGTRDYMQLGQEAIVAVRKNPGDQKYMYDEVVPTLSASALPTRASLFAIAGICDLQRWQPPQNATTNKCPLCGTASFTDNVINAEDPNLSQSACYVNGTLQIGISGCEFFALHSFDNTSTCVPTAYSQTCTRLVFDMPTATCECNDANKVFHGSYGDVGEGARFVASWTMLVMTLIAAVMAM